MNCKGVDLLIDIDDLLYFAQEYKNNLQGKT